MNTEERLGRIEAMLLRSGQRQAEIARAVEQLIIKVDGLIDDSANFKQEILQYLDNARLQRQVFQAESRHTWGRLGYDEGND